MSNTGEREYYRHIADPDVCPMPTLDTSGAIIPAAEADTWCARCARPIVEDPFLSLDNVADALRSYGFDAIVNRDDVPVVIVTIDPQGVGIEFHVTVPERNTLMCCAWLPTINGGIDPEATIESDTPQNAVALLIEHLRGVTP